MIKKIVLLSIVLIFASGGYAQDHYAPEVSIVPVIDGVADDEAWDDAEWYDISEDWVAQAGWVDTNPDGSWKYPFHGARYDADWSGGDYSGRFKCVWKGDRIYVLAEIIDDVLHINYTESNFMSNYWDADLLEVFIDEDDSDGWHDSTHTAFNAFAYHMLQDNYRAMDNTGGGAPSINMVDYGMDFMMKVKEGMTTYIWEAEIPVFTDEFLASTTTNNPTRTLSVGDQLGFSVAYCDDDGIGRGNFFGSKSGGTFASTNADSLGILEITGPVVNTLLETADLAMSVYPNPSTGLVIIEADVHDAMLTVVSVLGHVVYQGSMMSSATTVDLSHVSKGIYFVVLDTPQGKMTETLVIK